jgi:hypothetical protein
MVLQIEGTCVHYSNKPPLSFTHSFLTKRKPVDFYQQDFLPFNVCRLNNARTKYQ